MSVQIPQPLFESLQAAFLGEAKRICRDAAKILKVDEKELLQKVFPQSAKVKLQIVDTEEAPVCCQAFLQEDALLKRCRHPSLLGTGRCIYHQTATIPDIPATVTPLVRLERLEKGDCPLWCFEETGEVYDSTGAVIGEYRDETLILYVLEDELAKD
jgi:hypothetical protein